jgi:signal transduction histidine kinase
MSNLQPQGQSRIITITAIGVVFIVFFLFAVNHLLQKPGIPAGYSVDSPSMQVTAIDSSAVATVEDVEFLLSHRSVGDSVRVVLQSTEGTRTVVLPVVSFYSVNDIAFSVAVSLAMLLLGIAVFYYKPGHRTSTVFALATATLASAIVGTKTLCSVHPPALGIALGGFFFLAYSTIAVQFFHFTLLFPVEQTGRTRRILPLLYLLAGGIGIWQVKIYADAALTGSLDLFVASVRGAIWLNGFVVAVIVISLINLVVSYRRAATSQDRQKLRWILFGLSIGTTPFVFLWALPQAFGLSPWIPELLFKFFLLAIPVTFAISIVKYRLMDIDLVINRSVVYTIVLGLLLLVYAGLVGLVAEIASVWTTKISLTVSTIAAMVIALLFEPLRRLVQRTIDRTFFRVRYDFRVSYRTFVDGLKRCMDEREIARLLIDHTAGVVPVSGIGFFSLAQPGNRLRMLSHQGFDLLVTHSVGLDVGRITSPLHIPIARPESVEPGVTFEAAEEEVFHRWGMALVIPLKSKTTGILGFLVLGEKKSGNRFTVEDIDLLNAISAGAASEIERILLHRKVIVEQAEARRLEELNRLKSYFVSSVSHDLKTPLTSIALFAELLKSNRGLGREEISEYLSIIEGESHRLTRLIDNVLDFAKIERGVKEYHMRETELSSLAEKALAIMQYQFTMAGCAVREAYSPEPLIISADPDAVIEALLNLLSNALKYSGAEKKISIETSIRDGTASVSITDNGLGITEEDRKRLFEPFFRASTAGERGAGGAGLGLSIVKHIIDAHVGTIRVDSTPGKGSTFTLLFPA